MECMSSLPAQSSLLDNSIDNSIDIDMNSSINMDINMDINIEGGKKEEAGESSIFSYSGDSNCQTPERAINYNSNSNNSSDNSYLHGNSENGMKNSHLESPASVATLFASSPLSKLSIQTKLFSGQASKYKVDLNYDSNSDNNNNNYNNNNDNINLNNNNTNNYDNSLYDSCSNSGPGYSDSGKLKVSTGPAAMSPGGRQRRIRLSLDAEQEEAIIAVPSNSKTINSNSIDVNDSIAHCTNTNSNSNNNDLNILTENNSSSDEKFNNELKAKLGFQAIDSDPDFNKLTQQQTKVKAGTPTEVGRSEAMSLSIPFPSLFNEAGGQSNNDNIALAQANISSRLSEDMQNSQGSRDSNGNLEVLLSIDVEKRGNEESSVNSTPLLTLDSKLGLSKQSSIDEENCYYYGDSFSEKSSDGVLSPSSKETGMFGSILKWARQSPRSPSNMLKKKVIVTPWSFELQQLEDAQSAVEVTEIFSRMKKILSTIDKTDRIKFCFGKFNTAISKLKKDSSFWNEILQKDCSNLINCYFSQNCFWKTPDALVQEILKFLPPREFSKLSGVSREFNRLLRGNNVWSDFFERRFPADAARSLTISHPKSVIAAEDYYFGLYFRRLMCPQIGDKVEVAWSGKFRLAESVDVYHGNAWWMAEVVDILEATNLYKVHYPGWDVRWDEWISRQRLRWVTVADPQEIDQINVGDKVELWCCGAQVPGAWLESQVVSVRNNRYCVSSLTSAGPTSFWVERERVRPLRVSFSFNDFAPNNAANARSSGSSTVSGGSSTAASQQGGSACAIM